ncbi:MAG: methionyl-tRNA formyltransferase [Deltaproteobacteria bacterium]|nr:methionyl-tRNA formyltransferase [Deltaproteobacteria bacterium]
MNQQCPILLPARPRIIFMGTPDFALPSLKALIAHDHHVQAVVTQPDRPRGRSGKPEPPPVKKAAKRFGIEVFQPERASDESFCGLMGAISPDLLVVIAFGQLLTAHLLNIPLWGGLNIHASLLPKYRGAAPIQRAVMNNDRETGVTAMRMEQGLDTGPILLQEKTHIGAHETAGELHDRLANISATFLLKTLERLAQNGICETPQDDTHATYAAKIDRTTGRISWDLPADQISSLIRGLDPWPGAYTSVNGKTLKLFSSRVVKKGGTDTVPGRIKEHCKEGLMVETADGVILVRALQLAGKKRLSALDFLRGFPLKPGTVLGPGTLLGKTK